jgi:hypothetical protein
MNSPLKKYLLPALVIPCTVFGISTLPLAVLSSQQVAVQVQDEPVFQGQLREIASPYLVLATTVSAAIGVAGVAVTGWKQSTSKSSELEDRLSEKQAALQHKEAQLEELKLSANFLAASGLDAFVDMEIEQPQRPVAQEAVVTASPVIERPKLAIVPTVEPEVQRRQVIEFPTAAIQSAPAPIDTIQTQVEQLKAQLEMLTAALSVQSSPAVQSEPVVAVEPVVSEVSAPATITATPAPVSDLRMSDLRSPLRHQPRRHSAVAV